MLKKHIWYYCLVCLICLFQHVYSANIKSVGVPNVRNYSKNIYQSGNQNWSVTKDPKGIMYFGNSEGLLSFDGQDWQQYYLPNHLTIRAVASDGQGKIYTGAFGEIGYWSADKRGLMYYTSLSKLIPSKYALNEEIWKIYIDEHQIIFQSFGTVYVYRNSKIAVIKSPNPYLFLFKAGKRYFIEQINTGLFELVNGKLELIKGSEILKTGILSILPFSGGSFLIGTAKDGLFIYSGKQIYPWKNKANEFLKKYQLNNGAFIPGKYYAYGTILNGVIIVDTAGNVVQHINKLNLQGSNIVPDIKTPDQLIDEAVATAGKADVVVAFLGEPYTMTGEAASRSDISLPENQRTLLKALKAIGKPIVLVLMNGRPLTLTWENKHLDAVLETWYAGTRTGDAIADVLFGKYNPSGKLTITFPRSVGQIPIYYNAKNTGRPFNAAEKYTSKYLDIPNSPLYPFGYGLSYTTFSYGPISLNKSTITAADQLKATVTLTNTGKYDGVETAQLYIRDMIGTVTRPVKELKGFQKVFLKAGESKTITFTVTANDLKFYDINMKYTFEPGDFKLFIGTNSQDVKEADFTLTL